MKSKAQKIKDDRNAARREKYAKRVSVEERRFFPQTGRNATIDPGQFAAADDPFAFGAVVRCQNSPLMVVVPPLAKDPPLPEGYVCTLHWNTGAGVAQYNHLPKVALKVLQKTV